MLSKSSNNVRALNGPLNEKACIGVICNSETAPKFLLAANVGMRQSDIPIGYDASCGSIPVAS